MRRVQKNNNMSEKLVVEAQKVYVVTIDFELTSAPAWLSDFRKKYDKPYSPHLTLKNSSYLQQGDASDLESILATIVKKYQSMKIVFSEYSFATTVNGHVIMVLADRNELLIALQKEVRESCAHFGEHTRTDFKEYETNFKPHLTIARELNDKQFAEAKDELSERIACQTTLRDVTLMVYDSLEAQKRMDAPMKKVFQLGV